VELPSHHLKKPCGRFYSIDEVRKLLSAAAAAALREHLIVRIFLVCGLRAQEMFVLRVDDCEEGDSSDRRGAERNGEGRGPYRRHEKCHEQRLCFDQSRLGKGNPNLAPASQSRRSVSHHRRTSTERSSISDGDRYAVPNRELSEADIKAAGTEGRNHGHDLSGTSPHVRDALQRYGSPKDAQTQLRHSKLEMTGWYMKEIPASVRAAVEKMDADLCAPQPQTQPEYKKSIQ
jgi:integrase